MGFNKVFNSVLLMGFIKLANWSSLLVLLIETCYQTKLMDYTIIYEKYFNRNVNAELIALT